MPRPLVLVESPAKARKLATYLPDMIVESTIGHFRDLPRNKQDLPAALRDQPWAWLGIDLNNDFAPVYLIPQDKASHIAKLRRLAGEAPYVVLASDDDREGEAISAHVVEEFKLQAGNYRRAVFHEITKDAVLKAVANPRDVDWNLVQAQETRRVLDRLYGYQVSAALSGKARNLTAGRVQSVAVKMIAVREQERTNFVKAPFTSVTVTLDSEPGISANATHVDGQPLATGKDFDAATGQLKTNAHLLTPEKAARFVKELRTGELEVVAVDRKPFRQASLPPFTTSTLQQEASRKLRLGPGETMSLAQTLYEQGFITYMRTDSVALSDEAIEAARAYARKQYGPESVTPAPRTFSVSAGAQAAHEAIRPAGNTWADPKATAADIRSKLKDGDQAAALYDLIFKRTVATQMTEQEGEKTTATLKFEGKAGEMRFLAQGKVTTAPGWTQAYTAGVDDAEEGADDPEDGGRMPAMTPGQTFDVTSAKANAKKTNPPARYTEAALVHALETEGIGRPSTYAAIMKKIIDGGYARKKGMSLIPTWQAMASHAVMERDYPLLVDLKFTAKLEADLDLIAAGKASRVEHLSHFQSTLQDIIRASAGNTEPLNIPHRHAREAGVTVSIDSESQGVILHPDGRSSGIPANITPDELTPERIEELLRAPLKAAPMAGGKVIGACPRTGQTITLKTSKNGEYLHRAATPTEPEKTASLPKGENMALLDATRAGLILDVKRRVLEGTPRETLIQMGQHGPYAMRKIGTRPVFKNLSVPRAMEITESELDALFQ